MEYYTISFVDPDQTTHQVPVGIGDTYETLGDFFNDFLKDHPGYQITHIAEQV